MILELDQSLQEEIYLIKHQFFLNDDYLTLRFINKGTLPALGIKTKYYFEIKDKNNDLKRNFISLNKIVSGLGPNEVYREDIKINQNYLQDVKDSSQCYFGVKINYVDNNKRDYYYLFEGHFEKNSTIFDNVDMN